MTPRIEAIVAELLERHRRTGRVDLDDIAEVVGLRAVSYEEVELIIERLEAEGLRVGEPLDEGDVAVMHAILAAARRLRLELGRRPTIEEIAAASDHAPHTVRRALEHAQRASRAGGT
jgi:hypothetical protein